MFEYIENIDYDLEQKGQDFIKILSLLHAKTSYYKQCDVDEYKILFEDIYNRLVDINNYYNNLINVIESKVYMSPAEYLVARNITNIFLLINYCFDELKKWFELVKNNTKKRVVTLYNNTDINSLLKSTDNIYLTDFSKSTIDLPIYDLYSF